MPQQNGVVESTFATLYNKCRAMSISAAGLTLEKRGKLWTECANAATLLDIITSKDGNQSPFDLFYGNARTTGYKHHLHPFGEIAYIANRIDIQSKMANRGTKVVFLGYAIDHAANVYRLLDPNTQRLKLS